MSIIALILGALGSVVSVAQSRWCYVIWTFPNIYWSWYNWGNGEKIQSAVFVVMFWTCLAGWLAWGRAKKDRAAELSDIQVILTWDHQERVEALKRENLQLREKLRVYGALAGQYELGNRRQRTKPHYGRPPQ